MNIDGKEIGHGKPVFIIAEAGVNHNGSIETAKKLVDVAKAADVDAVKFQSFKAEKEVTKEAKKADYQREGENDEEPYFDLIKKLEFNKKTHQELIDYCKRLDILFLSTPSEEASAEMLRELDLPAFKIGSNDITTLAMLKRIARYHKPMILSRGMATTEEIQDAISTIEEEGNKDIALLHCTSNYPTPLQDANLQAIITLRKTFKQITGYSDHTEGITAPKIAALLGAEIIEKHYTLDKTLPGPDHTFALDPEELTEMVKEIRRIESMSEEEKKKELKNIPDIDKILGDGKLEPNDEELKMRVFTRKSIVAKTNLKKGTVLSLENITFKRPGDGVLANEYKNFLGKTLTQDLEEDQKINYEIIE